MTVLDVIALVAATAAGLAAMRALYFDRWLGQLQFARGRWVAYDALGLIRVSITDCEPLFACWAVALLALRMRAPRPRARRLLRHPGMAACFVVSLGVLLGAFGLAIRMLTIAALGGINIFEHIKIIGPSGSEWPSIFSHLVEDALHADTLAFGIVAAWALLALSRGCRRGRGDWLDRAGLAVGLLCLVAGLMASWGIVEIWAAPSAAPPPPPPMMTLPPPPPGP